METSQKNDLLLQVADLGLKKVKNKTLTADEESKLQEILSELGMSFEDAIKEAEQLLLR